MNPRGFWEPLQEHYDKLLAAAALAALLGCLVYLQYLVGVERIKFARFKERMDEMKPEHPQAEAVELAVYAAAKVRLEEPPQIEPWTNALLFVPETRVWCVDCKRPIPLRARTCPFCKAEQPLEREDDPERDEDRDGMKDVWELAQGLNPHDPADAAVDSDGDGFLNIEEFRYGTNPRAAEDHPPVTAKLSVKEIKAHPFKFLFKSVLTMPDGSKKFAVNAQGDRETFFLKMGDAIGGFVVEAFEPRLEEVETRAGNLRRDRSVLRIRQGEKVIPLVLGEAVPHTEHTATLLSRVDGSEFAVKPGDGFEIRGERFAVISVDMRKQVVVIERAVDGKRLELGKLPQMDTGASGE